MLEVVQQCRHRWLGHVLSLKSLLWDRLEGRGGVKDKTSRRRKQLQLIMTKSYAAVKSQLEDGNSRKQVKLSDHRVRVLQ